MLFCKYFRERCPNKYQEEDDLHSNEKEKNNTGIESQYMGDGNENYVMEEIRIPKVQIYLFEGDAEKNERND